ncbi:hypothetical protein E2C01_056873 [Portunus trituberculatus]|uniref:Uncharacterized protein n=1 Tax=Portunus trituberculatus TaxID=210409 RepID=A0A5B7GYK4_PORTR|nr:hypothetical protein [Portunus trituberculatus]
MLSLKGNHESQCLFVPANFGARGVQLRQLSGVELCGVSSPLMDSLTPYRAKSLGQVGGLSLG